MAIFRDLKGGFFSIPDSELEKYRISPADVANCRQASSAPSGAGGEPQTIVVNQFFAPFDQASDIQGQCCNDFAAQYTYPNAWGGVK